MIGTVRGLIRGTIGLLAVAGALSACNLPAGTSAVTPRSTNAPADTDGGCARPGERLYTHIDSPENGKIAVRVDLPAEPRYGESAPVVVVASTWFVQKYTPAAVGFHDEFNPVDVGAMAVFHLWPGKIDPESNIASEGTYDFGGPDSLAALRDTIRFALGQMPNTEGKFLHELVETKPLYGNVGMFASSHAGVAATNVMAYYGRDLTGLKYFVGRENPTMAEMYPLEIGHFNEAHEPLYNPYYLPEGYTPTSIAVDYSHLGWIRNERYPEGRPVFEVPGGEDYVLDDKGPHINGKRFFSHALTQALFDNGVFTMETWPPDVATPQETADFWPYRITVHNYAAIGENLPELRVLISFAACDHVQTAHDKPHIRQAYDGFRKTAGLWTRLNGDLAYVQSEVHPSASLSGGFPDNDANREPGDWPAEAELWGFEGKLAGQLTTHSIPLAAVAEMADRVRADDWSPNLAAPLGI
jgi:hypothetical protein